MPLAGRVTSTCSLTVNALARILCEGPVPDRIFGVFKQPVGAKQTGMAKPHKYELQKNSPVIRNFRKVWLQLFGKSSRNARATAGMLEDSGANRDTAVLWHFQ
jgi:hypothetical protein